MACSTGMRTRPCVMSAQPTPAMFAAFLARISAYPRASISDPWRSRSALNCDVKLLK